MDFMDGFRRGCADARAACGVPPLEPRDAEADAAADEEVEDELREVRIAELTERLRPC
jgi:hypothetical protein